MRESWHGTVKKTTNLGRIEQLTKFKEFVFQWNSVSTKETKPYLIFLSFIEEQSLALSWETKSPKHRYNARSKSLLTINNLTATKAEEKIIKDTETPPTRKHSNQTALKRTTTRDEMWEEY